MNDGALAIDLRGLTKRFGARTVVDALSMQVRRGEVFGFLGPNGSGKTTSIRMMCGLLTADGGEGHTLGWDIRREAAQIKREVGYMTQRFGLYEDLSIRENLAFVASIYGMDRTRQRVDTALERLGLQSRQHQLAGSLSGGWKQRLTLAACMLHEPRLLLLDEPTAGVDPKARRDFWEEIHRLASQGITVLVSTHYMDEAERCHRLGYIAYGRLMACGTPQELVERSALHTWQVGGEGITALAEALQGAPGVEMVTHFGNSLHVSGSDAAALEAATAAHRADPRQHWQLTRPALEDLFIHLMGQAHDNFTGNRAS
ncbi:MAG: multidrug ABC transporter ATP-binding protein [Candidatus Dactylopiibacterium carminicum]|uniref:ABC transporter ATP-binding protein n=1 Tax=Candidatus Dactylopiibacterium carminicum TaxID=857335 RepID=A0A272EWI2_9RHOO|nr:ABC transporter ATP-binding protein [Candidatus Dactylopiibacterium carminicum]KAF7599574.1 ABC transporter ATP-binding protein [Candidatus Dactylopiibacterium carminicum]PAS94416.1 MAG: multidrug ABC transporter ATP-binding protein [Candidatus Dactylopiibacterium carminicum]PAS99577.1 MAG: multidrug ABC transporter ATP-binding protein [Candidatus Dactylopiibacterium carminicum]